jgi:hypothetical protein
MDIVTAAPAPRGPAVPNLDMKWPVPVQWGDVRVPYTAIWTAELKARAPRFVFTQLHGNSRRLRMLSEGIEDMTGKPVFSRLHADRCRRVVRMGVCQMCCQPLPSTVVSVNQGQTDAGRPLIDDGLPMCPACALQAYDACPGMQRQEEAGTLRFWLSPRLHWLMAPVLLGVVPPESGGDQRINDLIERANAPIWTGPKLVLVRFRRISLPQLRERVQEAT